MSFFFFQAEDGIRDAQESRGLGDVYKRQGEAQTRQMAQYVVKRILFSLLVLGAISIIVFSAVRLIPGDVCSIVLQTPDVQQSQCDAINKELGIDQPVVTQYFKYMGGILKGDFGESLITKREVFTEMKDRIPLTIELLSLIHI